MTASACLWDSMAADLATSGTSSCSWQASGVSIDTRTLSPGDVFVALQGPNFDGHRFAGAAAKARASAIVASRDLENCDPVIPVLRVADTQAALEMLGIESRNRMRGKIIAVTGSVGKTGTREMLKVALSGQGNISASAGNLNNHWGLPLSLSRMPADTDFGIFELGMNHPDEIRPLAKLAKPHVAIVTAIEAVHAEYFDSVDEIADAKAEIFEGVVDGGCAVLNRDSDYFDHLSSRAAEAGVNTVYGFGYHRDAWAHIRDVTLNHDGSDVTVDINGTAYRYSLHAPGEHLVKNSAAVLTAVFLAGGNVESASARLSEFQPPEGRGNRSSLKVAGGEVLLINESYNASPASMRAAMNVVGHMKPKQAGRRIAVLGDMLELGPGARQAHRELLKPLEANAFDVVFTAGTLMQNLWDELPDSLRGGHSISPEKLALVIESALRPGDVVMVKGSLGSRMGTIVDALANAISRQSSGDRK